MCGIDETDTMRRNSSFRSVQGHTNMRGGTDNSEVKLNRLNMKPVN